MIKNVLNTLTVNSEMALGIVIVVVCATILGLGLGDSCEDSQFTYVVIGVGITLVLGWITRKINVGTRPWEKPLYDALFLIASSGYIEDAGISQLGLHRLNTGQQLIRSKKIEELLSQVSSLDTQSIQKNTLSVDTD